MSVAVRLEPSPTSTSCMSRAAAPSAMATNFIGRPVSCIWVSSKCRLSPFEEAFSDLETHIGVKAPIHLKLEKLSDPHRVLQELVSLGSGFAALASSLLF